MTPLLASQHVCLKTLSMIRSLVRSDGQALLLRNSDGENPSTNLTQVSEILLPFSSCLQVRIPSDWNEHSSVGPKFSSDLLGKYPNLARVGLSVRFE